MNIDEQLISYSELCEIITNASKIPTSQRNSNITIGMELVQIKVKNYIIERESIFAEMKQPQ